MKRSIDPGFPFLIHFHTHLKGSIWMWMIEYETKNKRKRNGMGKYDHSKHKMMIVIQYEESRIVYLFDDLEAPTSYSCWSRSNINNSVFFSFFFSYISLTALQSNCQVHYLLVYIYGISKVGKEFMIINVNRCSNSLHSVSYQSHKIMK